MTDNDALGAALGRLNRATRRSYQVVTDGYEYRANRVVEELAHELGYVLPRRDFTNRNPSVDDLYPAFVADQEHSGWWRDQRRHTLLRVLGLAGGDPADIATVLAAFGLEPRDEEFANHIDERNEQVRQHWLKRYQEGQAHLEANAYERGRREVLADLRTLTHSGILDTRGDHLASLDATISHEAEQAEATPFPSVLSVNTAKDGQRVSLTGIFGNLDVRTSVGENSREFACGLLADDTGRVNVIIWPNRYADAKDLIIDGAQVTVTGRVEKWGGLQLMVTTVESASAEVNR